MIFGGIEAGGTKWVCAIGTGATDVREATRFPTTTPDETIARAAEFFTEHGPVAAVGVGTFGPIDLRYSSPTWGRITTTTKPGWANTDIWSALRAHLDVPVAFDTDVNAAALGEGRWGAAAGFETFCYVTVGTGIGGGAMVNGRLLHGLLHPEFGHMRVPHDYSRDPFAGGCPYHGDCLEGLASGDAIRRRCGKPGEEVDDESAWELVAAYLGLGLVNVISVLSPQRIILGGGVMRQPQLLSLVRRHVREFAAGYFDTCELTAAIDDYVVGPDLGDSSGVIGAIELARDASDGR